MVCRVFFPIPNLIPRHFPTMSNSPKSDSPSLRDAVSTVFSLSSEDVEKRRQLYTDVVAKYYGDPDFKAKMDADPAGVLRAEGFSIPEGVEVKLAFNTPKRFHILLPAPGAYPDK